MSDTDTFVCHVVVWTSLVRTHFGQCGGYRTIFQDCMWQHVRGSLALVAFEHFTSIESTSKCRRILHLFFETICALLLQWQEWFGSFFSVVFLFFFFVFLVLSIKWAQSNFEGCADLCKPRFKQPHQALCLFNQFWNLSSQDFEYKSREHLRFNPTWLAGFALADLPTY